MKEFLKKNWLPMIFFFSAFIIETVFAVYEIIFFGSSATIWRIIDLIVSGLLSISKSVIWFLCYCYIVKNTGEKEKKSFTIISWILLIGTVFSATYSVIYYWGSYIIYQLIQYTTSFNILGGIIMLMKKDRDNGIVLSRKTDAGKQLLALKNAKEAGVLTEEEYDTKRAEIIAKL